MHSQLVPSKQTASETWRRSDNAKKAEEAPKNILVASTRASTSTRNGKAREAREPGKILIYQVTSLISSDIPRWRDRLGLKMKRWTGATWMLKK